MPSRSPAASTLINTFTALSVAAVFLQKFGLTVGDASVGLDALLLPIGLGYLVARGVAEIVVTRLILLLMTLIAGLVGIAFSADPARLSAPAIMIVMYAGLAVRARADADTVSACLAGFQKCMLVIGAIVIGQQLLQYTVGNAYWPNIEALVPQTFLYQGFAYIRPYSWQSPYLTPNGVFFLEPSVVSSYLAMAIMIEIVWFKDPVRIAFYASAMVLGVAATGPVGLLVTAPIWGFVALRRLPILWLGVPLLAIAYFAGLFDNLLERSGEMSATNSSGYFRMVAPLQSILDQIQAPDAWLTGNGPGTSARSRDAVQWPFSKLLYEYGLLTALWFHAYLCVCLFGSPPSRILAGVIFVPYLFFGGGFVSHATVMPLVLFCSLLRLAPSPAPARAAYGVRVRPAGLHPQPLA